VRTLRSSADSLPPGSLDQANFEPSSAADELYPIRQQSHQWKAYSDLANAGDAIRTARIGGLNRFSCKKNGSPNRFEEPR
jgi:hypothetical protein